MASLITSKPSVIIQAANHKKTAMMMKLILGTLLIIEGLVARVTKNDDIIEIKDTQEHERVTSFIDEDDTDIEEPARDIWAWGLINERYLPHVRSRIVFHVLLKLSLFF